MVAPPEKAPVDPAACASVPEQCGGWAAVVAGARGDELARLAHENVVGAEERLGKTDAAGIGVVQVEIGFEEFICVGGNGVFHSGRCEIINRAE